MELKYDLNDSFNKAIMIKTPMILVEGRDDIQTYERIISGIKEVEILATENFEELSGGNHHVVAALEILKPKINERAENTYYILGIIDRDARFYRNEIPEDLEELLVLKYYSIESHFVSKKNLSKVIYNITYATEGLVNDGTVFFVESDFNNVLLEKLYYFSLDALKRACDRTYTSTISYSTSEGSLYDYSELYNAVISRKSDLEIIANEMNITFDLENVKRIAKGKWLTYFYSKAIWEKIRQCRDACKNDIITKCQFCQCGNHNDCLYRPRASYNNERQIESELLKQIDEDEVKYIKERVMSLKN